MSATTNALHFVRFHSARLCSLRRYSNRRKVQHPRTESAQLLVKTATSHEASENSDRLSGLPEEPANLYPMIRQYKFLRGGWPIRLGDVRSVTASSAVPLSHGVGSWSAQSRRRQLARSVTASAARPGRLRSVYTGDQSSSQAGTGSSHKRLTFRPEATAGRSCTRLLQTASADRDKRTSLTRAETARHSPRRALRL